MQTEVNKKPDATVELTVTLPWSTVKKTYDKVVADSVKTVEIKGFRKGKAPRKLAEEKLDKEKIWQKVLGLILPNAYSKAIQKEKIKPIISPQIQLFKASPNNDLIFKATTCESPEVKLADYKKALQEIKKEAPKIWTPASAKNNKAAKKDKDNNRVTLDKILNKLLQAVKLDLPQILLEQQTNKNLTQLLDQIKQLGMTIQQYAQSKGKTVEQIREDTKKEAEASLKLEFILEKIADAEKIIVTDKEIDDMINKTKDEKQRKNLQNQRYYIASVLRRQKTLQSLLA